MPWLFVLFQHILPQHLLSRLIGKIAASKRFSKVFINWFAKRYRVDMSEALHENLSDYETFNAFFTRALKPSVRPVASDANGIVCPADGVVSQIGDIRNNLLLQAKGHNYSVEELLAGAGADASSFLDGSFATIYLSPKDYHRVHMPVSGTLEKMRYVPGALFSVNQQTAEAVSGLFARNERAVCLFDTEAGPMAVVLVGAMIVAGIETVWSGRVCPSAGSRVVHETDYGDYSPRIAISSGDEMGRFYLGSTAIVLFGPGAASFDTTLCAGAAVKMGQLLGTYTRQ